LNANESQQANANESLRGVGWAQFYPMIAAGKPESAVGDEPLSELLQHTS
jgi:hypothetical protein